MLIQRENCCFREHRILKVVENFTMLCVCVCVHFTIGTRFLSSNQFQVERGQGGCTHSVYFFERGIEIENFLTQRRLTLSLKKEMISYVHILRR